MSTDAISQSHSIPQLIPVAIVVAYYPWALGSGVPMDTIVEHTVTALAALVAAVLLFRGGGFGGGALKLTIAIILWLGVWQSLVFVFLSYMALGLYGFVEAKVRGRYSDVPYWPFAALALVVMKWSTV